MQKFFFGYWLTKVKNHDNITKVRLSGQEKRIAAVAQSVERRIGSAEVTGPIPVSSSNKYRRKHVNSRFACFFVFSGQKTAKKLTSIFNDFVGENGGKRGGKILRVFRL